VTLLAVDVVLLPDAETVERVLRINRELVSTADSEIHLDVEHCLPHASLAMGCIAETDLDAVHGVLSQIAVRHPLDSCPCTGMVTRISGSGRTVSSLELERTSALQALHEAVITDCAPYFHTQVSPDMLTGEGPIAASTLEWIGTYRENSSFQHYWPHITLGYGNATGQPVPTVMRPRHLAVCHLGNHCTCRRVLAQVDLGSK
jgi:hypothetical protein